ncbi:hypothetical protein CAUPRSCDRAFT_13305, partial [Caulochytrium protostelioides]
MPDMEVSLSERYHQALERKQRRELTHASGTSGEGRGMSDDEDGSDASDNSVNSVDDDEDHDSDEDRAPRPTGRKALFASTERAARKRSAAETFSDAEDHGDHPSGSDNDDDE